MGADGAAVETELDRDIGLLGAIALGVGTMIAAGIFVLSGLAVANVGAAAILSFLVAAVVASFTAFAYAEFASLYPESGGGYMYVANVFDTDLTYIVGWSMILGYPASAAFYLASFSDWFFRFIHPVLDIPAAVPYWASGTVVLLLLVGLNLKGTEEAGTFQVAVTAAKIVLIGLFLYGGLQAFDSATIVTSFAQHTASLSDVRDLGVTSALVFITFFGFEAIATNAEEIESPARTVPRAIFISMGMVTVVYTLVVLVVVLAINTPEFLDFLVSNTPVSTLTEAERFVAENGELAMGNAAAYYLGPVGFYVIIVGALFSMLSAANATILAGSRVKLAMARRDHLPAGFEDLHETLNTPYKSVLLTGALILFYLAVFAVLFGEVPGSEASAPLLGIHLGIEALAHFADFMLLGGLIVVNLAIIQSRRADPDVERGFEVPFVPWVPIVAVLANLVLLVNVEPQSFVIGVVAELIGVGVWFAVLSGGPSAEAIEAETPTLVAEHRPTDREYQVAVPISNPDHVPQLMRTAASIARERDGGILVVSVVDLPAQTPLTEGSALAAEHRDVLDEALALADDAGVPVSGVVRIGHDVPASILHTVDQHGSDAVLLGWRGHSHRRDIVLGSTVDEVVRDADCDVFVERIREGDDDAIDSVLLPTAGGPHADLAGEVAGAVARTEGARVEIAYVLAPDAEPDRRAAAEDDLTAAANALADVDCETSLLVDDDVVSAIVEASVDHDLTVVGATREGLLQQLVFGAIPEAVAREAESTVIMAKRYLAIPSKLRGWLR